MELVQYPRFRSNRYCGWNHCSLYIITIIQFKSFAFLRLSLILFVTAITTSTIYSRKVKSLAWTVKCHSLWILPPPCLQIPYFQIGWPGLLIARWPSCHNSVLFAFCYICWSYSSPGTEREYLELAYSREKSLSSFWFFLVNDVEVRPKHIIFESFLETKLPRGPLESERSIKFDFYEGLLWWLWRELSENCQPLKNHDFHIRDKLP